MEQARAAFNALLARLYLYERYDPERVKFRLIELCSLLSRSSIERGAEAAAVLEMNEKLLRSIMSSSNLDEISYQIHSNLDIFTESLFFSAENGSSIVKRATEYIHAHLSEKLSLVSAAEKAGVSAAYLSTLFRRVTGDSFQNYVNKVRVEEAKRLLMGTDYPILEIALACGFSDQSYFSKVFKKYTGLSPAKYR